MDVDRLRNDLIEFNDLQNTEDTYKFYYDETNNIRKLYLTDNGLNVTQSDNFVLAGILHKDAEHNADFSVLFDALNLQKTANELKLKHIAKGTFLDMLKSQKLCAVLKWLLENDFYIHYFNLNLIYWSIVDIVDSVIGELNHPFFIMHHMAIKSDFYYLVENDLDNFLKNLLEFNYPDVDKDRSDDFCRWLIYFIGKNSSNLPHFNSKVLNDLVNASLSIDELPLISGFHGKELIDDFMVFYLRSIYLFKNSKHIFDEEGQIEESINNFLSRDNGIQIQNYEFVRSHDYEAIQLSDVIAGFLGKYFTYLKDVKDEQLRADRMGLNTQQLETLGELKKLVDKSDDQSRGFFNVVSSGEEQRRGNYFLHGVESV